MLKPTPSSDSRSRSITSPDYSGLVQFLLSPFLESPESLYIDCEQANQNKRVWIRLAFEGSDKGRVYGRGGRNLQAIRTVLETAAATVGQSLYLDIYDSQSDKPKRRDYRDNRDSDSSFRQDGEGRKRRTSDRPLPSSRPSGRSRFSN
ncbi:MAG: KH domain-containing protein [Hydrococcus sp. Prado102]|jgi:hypothetical protein|nr:KH domain-containing protein [Hydrococcus sp. Prado102]